MAIIGRLTGIARRKTKRAPMEELPSTHISAETGVAGDFRGRPGERQITLVSVAAWRAACLELDAELPWTTRRANLLIDDIELPRSPGARIAIGDVRLEVTMETAPCNRMDEQHAGLTAALEPDWRGGVCCRVLTGGDVAVGDAVRIDSP